MIDHGIFERSAADWWNPQSRFSGSLHGLTEVRLQELHGRLGDDSCLVADLGCGGGLLAEPLAAAGALVVGCDLSGNSVREAHRHAAGAPHLWYLRGDAAAVPLASGSCDVVLLADVLEHVPDWRLLVREAARIARPGAVLYVNTLNRTWRARLLAVWLAEGLGLVPRGTHDHRLFVRPQELADEAAAAGFAFESFGGYRLRLWRTLMGWRLAFRSSSRPARSTNGAGGPGWGSYSAWFVRR